MPRSQAQGQRSGEGTAGLWKLLSEDDKLKNREPVDRRSNAQREQQERGGQHQEQDCSS